jgi:DNA-directed RNA polymerase subunit RPC12/RpoP
MGDASENTCKPGDDPRNGSLTITLPGRICRSHCTNCNADLAYILDAMGKGEIPAPRVCPQCGNPFREGEITKVVWRCPNCSGIIVNPHEQEYCTSCRQKLTCIDKPLEGEKVAGAGAPKTKSKRG